MGKKGERRRKKRKSGSRAKRREKWAGRAEGGRAGGRGSR